MKKYSQNQMSYTSQSFNRTSIPSYYDDHSQPETQQITLDIEQLKILIQNQVFRSLSLIKVQIQTKIKQIDKQIRDVKESIQNVQQTDNRNKIIELQQRQFQIVEKVKTIIEKNNRIPPVRVNESRKSSIDRSGYMNESRQRPSSKQRKPIFSKPQSNLSTVLFPFVQNQQPLQPLKADLSPVKQSPYIIPTYSIPQITQTIQQLNSLIINDVSGDSPFDIPLNMSPNNTPSIQFVNSSLNYLGSQKIVNYDSGIEGLIKNKNKFLKKRSEEKEITTTSQQKYGTIQEEFMQESVFHR